MSDPEAVGAGPTYRHTVWAILATVILTSLTTYLISFPVEFLLPYSTYFLSYGMFGLARPEVVYGFIQLLITNCLGATLAVALVSVVFRRANYWKVMWWCFGIAASLGVAWIAVKLFGISQGIEHMRDEIGPVVSAMLGLSAGYLLAGYQMATMPR